MNLEQFKTNNKFLMLALDHRGSFKKFINKENPDLVTDKQVIETKEKIIENLKEEFSGLLIDPSWGLPAYKTKNKPYLLCIEKTGYTGEESERITELEYNINDLKEMGASGVKLLVYFNPISNAVKKQLETAKKVMQEAKDNDIPLFLEIVTYGNEDINKTRKEWVLRSLDLFLDFDIKPDVYKLEYPDDLEGCQEITNKLKNIPWILLTRGVSFDVFKEQLKSAILAGAQGFLAGRALWQEIVDYKTVEEKEGFVKNIVVNRFKEINNIAIE